jgi:hypothetical protein
MPGLPDALEKEAWKDKINSYGKTWHTWMTGMRSHTPVTDAGDAATRPPAPK